MGILLIWQLKCQTSEKTVSMVFLIIVSKVKDNRVIEGLDHHLALSITKLKGFAKILQENLQAHGVVSSIVNITQCLVINCP